MLAQCDQQRINTSVRVNTSMKGFDNMIMFREDSMGRRRWQRTDVIDRETVVDIVWYHIERGIGLAADAWATCTPLRRICIPLIW
jgi:hypothetical protein